MNLVGCFCARRANSEQPGKVWLTSSEWYGSHTDTRCFSIGGNMKSKSIRSLITLSTAATIIFLGILLFTQWFGFQAARDHSHRQNAIALPAMLAMLESRVDVIQIQQFLTDASATGDDAGLKEAKAALEGANAHLDGVARLEPELAGEIGRIKEGLGKFYAVGLDMAAAYNKSGRDAGNALMSRAGDGFDAQATTLTEQLESLEKTVRTQMDESATTTESTIAHNQSIGIWLGILVAALLIASGVMVYRTVIGMLGCEPGIAANITHLIANGDLTQNIAVAANDRGSLLKSIHGMQENLRVIIRGIGDSAAALTVSAHDITQAATKVDGAASQQSEGSSAMAASIEEMAVSITHIADSADNVHQSSVETRKLVDSGKTTVDHAVFSMNGISDAVLVTAESVKALGEQSEKIARVVDVIRDIADQTNLLALNAAIEAARAGEQGRGFAVVADEVRKLAERTTQATTEIKQTVDAVRGGTASVIEEMSRERERVEQGVVQIREVGESMNNIHRGVDQVKQAAEEIAASLREQDAANQGIARNVEGIAQMTEETSAIVRNVVLSAEQLEKLSLTMSASVRRFHT
ncbi:MAG: methyl-accepting chemotaxis protein [Propionivibrio sp.]